jgi:hypothetical protein
VICCGEKLSHYDLTMRIAIGTLIAYLLIAATLDCGGAIALDSEAVVGKGLARGAVIVVILLAGAGLVWLISKGSGGRFQINGRNAVAAALFLGLAFNVYTGFFDPDPPGPGGVGATAGKVTAGVCGVLLLLWLWISQSSESDD